MTTTFVKPPPGASEQAPGPLISSDLRFMGLPSVIYPGSGEALESPAAPFARFAAKSSFPISGEGATVVASVPTDTATKTGSRTDDGPVDDR